MTSALFISKAKTRSAVPTPAPRAIAGGRDTKVPDLRWWNLTARAFLALVLVATVAACSKFNDVALEREDWSVQKYYNEAKRELNNKRYGDAIELYQELEAKYPYGPLSEQAQIEIIYAYYKDEEPAQALAAANRFIRLHPTHPNVDYAYYLKGLVNFVEHKNFVDQILGGKDLSDRDPQAAKESFAAFRELVQKFPKSRYAQDGRQRMIYLLNALAKHDIHVADYYLRRGAYVAVVNRCKYVIENYQNTPAVEDALGMMMIAYEKMGMNDLAQDARRILKTNFPNSRYHSAEYDPTEKSFSLKFW